MVRGVGLALTFVQLEARHWKQSGCRQNWDTAGLASEHRSADTLSCSLGEIRCLHSTVRVCCP